MRTIAVSIDEETLALVDRLAESAPSRRKPGRGRAGNRSKIVRAALQEFVARRDKATREERERRILAANRRRLAREAAALVREQAKL